MPAKRGTGAPTAAEALYASMGPAPSAAARKYGPERGREIFAEHKRWREQYLEAWRRGDRVPGPPYADEFTMKA